jgi:ribose transport system substrate-binding protein
VAFVGAAALLAACGSSAAPEPSASPTSGAAAPDFAQFLGKPSPDQCAGRTYSLGFDVFSDSQSFALATREGIDRAAATMGCVTVETLSDGADPDKAVQNAKIFMQKEKDGVILAQVIAAAQPGIVKVLKDGGAQGVATYVPAPGIPFVDVDNAKAGEKAGAALGEIAKEKWPSDVPYLLIGAFEEGGELSVARMKGYETGLRTVFPELPPDHIFYIPTKADPPTANANTSNILAKIPEGAKLLAGGINDETTLAMVQAIQTSGRGADYAAVGQGASVLDAVCKGQLNGSIGYFPDKYGDYLVPAVIALIQGQKVPDFVELPTELLTKDNIGEFYPDQACS